MKILYHFRVRGTGAEGVHIAGIANGFRALGHDVQFISPTGIDPTAVPPPSTLHPSSPALHRPPSTLLPTPSTVHPSSPALHRPPSTHLPPPSTIHPSSPALHRPPSTLLPPPSTVHPPPLSPPPLPLPSRLLHSLADHSPQILFELMEIAYGKYAPARIARAASEFHPDILYERYAFFNDAGACISRRTGIPLIVEVNELSGCSRVRGQILSGLAARMEKRIFTQASLVLTVSNDLKQRITQMLGNDRKVIVVPNGVSRTWLAARPDQNRVNELRQQLGLGGKKVIGFVGGLVHWHHFNFLLQALAEIQRKETFKTVLLLVGDGPERNLLMNQAQELGIAESVLITGTIPYPDIPRYLALFDAAIIPHSNEFRSPIKLFEYMGAGCAVVAPATEPIRAVITDGVNGLLFEPGDQAQFVSAIHRILTNRQLALDLGIRACKTVSEQYTWEQHATTILECFGTQREVNGH